MQENNRALKYQCHFHIYWNHTTLGIPQNSDCKVKVKVDWPWHIRKLSKKRNATPEMEKWH